MEKRTFYFDFISPFSFFAWRELDPLERELGPFELRPVPLGSLLNHWGIKGPGEVEPKRLFLLKSCLRHATRLGIRFTTPKTHPFNSLYSLRLALPEVAGAHQRAVMAALWEAGWQEGVDMGDPDVLLGVLRRAGLPADELLERTFSTPARSALKSNTAEAIAAGAFGVPSFVVDGELFWGKDSIPDMLAFARGADTLDRAHFERLVASTPRAAGQSIP